jgi:putative nucleotidyltransferase-like protein
MTTRRSDLPQAPMKPGLFPTPKQLLLLRACLESGAEARGAWEEWSSIVDFDHVDHESHYLLPMLDKNLRAIGVTGHPWLGRIKGYRRYIWANNRRFLARFSQVIQELHPIVGDNLLIIKGVALACGHYGDPGLRQTRDLDCMVKPDSVAHVLRHFKSLGWKIPSWIDWDRNRYGPDVETQCRVDQIPTSFCTDYPDGSVPPPPGQQSILSHDVNEDGWPQIQIDLHWYLMPDLCGTAANDTFWNSAVPMRLPDGSEVRTLQATDLLFHRCLHDIFWPWFTIPSTRWIVDAVTLLRDSKSIRWRHLVDLAEQLSYTLRLGTALSYLASTFPRQICIPEEVIQFLLNRDHSAEEIGEYQERMGLPPDGQEYPRSPMIFLHPATFSPSVFTDYQRFRFTYYWRFRVRSVPLNGSWLQEIRAFACFLRVRWGLPNLWLVFVIAPFIAARRIYRKYLRAGPGTIGSKS